MLACLCLLSTRPGEAGSPTKLDSASSSTLKPEKEIKEDAVLERKIDGHFSLLVLRRGGGGSMLNPGRRGQRLHHRQWHGEGSVETKRA